MVRFSGLQYLSLVVAMSNIVVAQGITASCADGCVEWCRTNFPDPDLYNACIAQALTCAGPCHDCGPQSFGGAAYLLADHANCGSCGYACSPVQTCCYGTCTSLVTNPLNCGACGSACYAGESCCDGQCINTNCDSSNCETCGNSCVAPTSACCEGTCTDLTQPASCGACNEQCPLLWNCCNGQCVDSSTDVNNCGGCGTACAANQVCCNAICQAIDPSPCACGGCAACAASETCCAGICYTANAFLNSPNNCGTCGHECGAGAQCCNGVCMDILWDAENCGLTCLTKTTCAAPMPQCCWGQCVNLAIGSDLEFCGACTSSCRLNGACCGGTCFDEDQLLYNNHFCGPTCTACASGFSCCQGACSNLQEAPNCGACGNCHGATCLTDGPLGLLETPTCDNGPCNGNLNTPQGTCGRAFSPFLPLVQIGLSLCGGGGALDLDVLASALSLPCVCLSIADAVGLTTCASLTFTGGETLNRLCEDLSDCTTSATCPSGSLCVTNLCCGMDNLKRNVCMPIGAPSGTCSVLNFNSVLTPILSLGGITFPFP